MMTKMIEVNENQFSETIKQYKPTRYLELNDRFTRNYYFKNNIKGKLVGMTDKVIHNSTKYFVNPAFLKK